MNRNYLTTAFRNLARNKAYSFINISGLSVGMTVTMLIGLWVWDELSFNTYHKNYHDIAQVWGGSINPQSSSIEGVYDLQYPVGTTLQENYPQHFKQVAIAFEPGDYTVATGDKKTARRDSLYKRMPWKCFP
jgi:putative ABC transport system permease protein